MTIHLHERLPHRPRRTVRRFWRPSPFAVMGLGFALILVALLSLEKAARADLPWLALGLVMGCLLFAAGLKAAPEKASEYVETGKLEWFE